MKIKLKIQLKDSESQEEDGLTLLWPSDTLLLQFFSFTTASYIIIRV